MNDEFEQQWLSDLPADWIEKRADFLCGPYRVAVDPDTFGDNLVAHYSIPQVQETGGPLIEPASDIDSSKLQINAPTLLVSKLNPRKKTICIAEPHSEYPTLASGEFVAIHSEEIDRRYAYYLWCSEKVTDRLSAIVQSVTRSHQRVNPADILKLPWKWPPLDMQQQIAWFLDEKTARIDDLIAKKRELLDRLVEKRQALITQAVTKDLNHETPMNLSDIGARSGDRRAAEGAGGMIEIPDKIREAYRELPPGWKLEKLKFFADIRNSNVDKTISEDEELVRLCNYTDVYYNDRITPDLHFMEGSATEAEIERFQLKRDQVIITKDSEGWDDIGIPALVTENMPEVLCGYHLSVFEPGPELDGGFLAWLCRAEPLNDQFKLAANGVTRFGLGQYPMRNAFIALPPPDTQRRIARILDEKTARIDRLIEMIEESVVRLEEYRSAQVTAAVTGQLTELS